MSSAVASQSPAQTTSSEAPTSSPGTSLSPQSSPSPNSSTDDSSTSSPETSTSPQATSTNVATTSTTPTTSSAAVATTPQSSAAAQTTSAAAGTTVASTAQSASSTSNAAAGTTTTSSFTSQVTTTLYSTDPAGSTIYYATTVPEVITTSISSGTSTTTSSSHTGVIVGAVVGGVAGITILVLLLFCIRKRVRRDEFDGNFDPDHVVGRGDAGGGTLPHVDLAEEVTPFPQPYTDQGSSSMRQYGDSAYIGVPSSPQSGSDIYSSVTSQSQQFMPRGPPPAGTYASPVNKYGPTAEWHTPRQGVSPPPSTSSYNTSSTRGAKEREALGRSGQGQTLGLATQPEAVEANADIVVHRDAGRAPIVDHAPPKEIPPAYESIPQD